jgi:hypothetical protein
MPHGLFFLCLSLFSPPHCVACTSWSSITPASEGEGERGCRQAGGKGRVETVWSPRSLDGVDGQNGSECTARWVVQGVLRATVWGTYCTTHCTCCTSTYPVQYHTTVRRRGGSIYYPPTLPASRAPRTVGSGLCAAASISAQVGWWAAAMTKTKGGRRERGARFGTVLYCTTDCPSAHSAVASVVYEHGKSAKYITPTHTHTRTPSTHTLSLTPSFVMTVSLL